MAACFIYHAFVLHFPALQLTTVSLDLDVPKACGPDLIPPLLLKLVKELFIVRLGKPFPVTVSLVIVNMDFTHIIPQFPCCQL